MAAATALLFEALRGVLDARGRVRLAIPGGSAMGVFVEVAASLALELDRVCLTWVDERCVPRDDPESNRGALHRAMKRQLASELPLHLDEETPHQALARVRGGLTTMFDDQLDVNLLGMGGDGHIASLFVGRAWPVGERVIHVADSPKPPAERITLTPTMLGTAARSILLATGMGKRGALERLVALDETLTATSLARLVVVTDQALEKKT